MYRLHLVVFSLTTLAIFIIGGTGVKGAAESSIHIIFALPLLSILATYIAHIHDHPILFPRNISLAFAGFVFFSYISFLFSDNMIFSGAYLLLYITSFLIFLFVTTFQKSLLPLIKTVVFVSTLFFTAYSAVINTFPDKLRFLIPAEGYQIVHSRFGSHNHLGDFLIVPISYCIYMYILHRQRFYLAIIAFCYPFYILSYSRSAYLSLFITTILIFIYLRHHNIVSTIVIMVILVTSTVFFAVTVIEPKYEHSQIPLYSVIREALNLPYKGMGDREQYVDQAILSVREDPFFGRGPGNFLDASLQYAQPHKGTSTAHNIFLDMIVENGALAFTCFLIVIFLILRSTLTNISALTFPTIALLLNFQTDYTHRINLFLLLFFILAGLQYKEVKDYKNSTLFILISLALIFVSQLLIYIPYV
jgi:O-antigen ligase